MWPVTRTILTSLLDQKPLSLLPRLELGYFGWWQLDLLAVDATGTTVVERAPGTTAADALCCCSSEAGASRPHTLPTTTAVAAASLEVVAFWLVAFRLGLEMPVGMPDAEPETREGREPEVVGVVFWGLSPRQGGGGSC